MATKYVQLDIDQMLLCSGICTQYRILFLAASKIRRQWREDLTLQPHGRIRWHKLHKNNRIMTWVLRSIADGN